MKNVNVEEPIIFLMESKIPHKQFLIFLSFIKIARYNMVIFLTLFCD